MLAQRKEIKMYLRKGDALALAYELRKSLVRLCTAKYAPTSPFYRHETDLKHIARLRRLHATLHDIVKDEDSRLIVRRVK